AAERVVDICRKRGVDVSFLANQFSIQRSGCPTTVIGTTKPHHIDSAVRAVTEPIDDELLDEILATTAAVRSESWISVFAENNCCVQFCSAPTVSSASTTFPIRHPPPTRWCCASTTAASAVAICTRSTRVSQPAWRSGTNSPAR